MFQNIFLKCDTVKLSRVARDGKQKKKTSFHLLFSESEAQVLAGRIVSRLDPEPPLKKGRLHYSATCWIPMGPTNKEWTFDRQSM